MTSVRRRRAAVAVLQSSNGEQVELGEAGQEPALGPVAAADGEYAQQGRHPDVACGEAAATGAFDKRA